MTRDADQQNGGARSIVFGLPLSEEPGLGTLTISGFLKEVCERYADREALVMHTDEGVIRWTYADFWDRSVEVARALLACGMGKGSRVGVLMTNRLEWLSGMFGASLAGSIGVALSTFSTPSELEYMLKSSGVSILLFEKTVLKKDFASIIRDLVPEVETAAPGEVRSLDYPFLRYLAMVGKSRGIGAIETWEAFLARGKGISTELVDATAATVMPCDPGMLLYSSGSTNKPKGILSSHRGVGVQLWRWGRIFALGDGIRSWTANGFFWSGNYGMTVGGTLSRGGAIVLQSTFNAKEALQLIQDEKVTFPIAWPHQWKQFEEVPHWEDFDLSSVYYVDRNTVLAKHPTVSTDWFEPIGAYGNTETFTIVSSFPACTPRADLGGEVLPGNTIKIVDPLTGKVVPRGQLGEIGVKGATLMLGYVGIPLDESLDDEGFLLTGDSGYLDEEGTLFWKGRLSDVIKTGGANVSPVEVDALLVTHPGIKVVKTVGIPHDTLGEIVVSCVVPFEGNELNADEIRAFAKEKLASYKVPRVVLFFREEELPQTGSNKVKSGELRELAAKRMNAS